MTQTNYNPIHKHLLERSAEICADNECTEDNHNCESYAYFDCDRETGQFSLATICISDYCHRGYDSYVCMPVVEDVQSMIDELESNLLE